MNELGPFNLWELFVLMVGGSALLGALGVWLVRRWLRGGVDETHNVAVVPLYATAAVIYAVLLAFTVIAVWEQYTSARADVSAEASRLSSMYRETQAMPLAERTALRAAIRRYTDAVIAVEWKAQQTGNTSTVARRSILRMYDVLGGQPPSVARSPANAQFLSDMSTLTAARATRFLATRDALPWVLWLALIVGELVVVGLGCLLFMENARLHAAISCAIGGLIGVLLFGTLVLDRPFQGAFGIKPDDFTLSVELYNSVDKTPSGAGGGTPFGSVEPG